jgi:EAL domain-containing protein (putative c-di-GMP-specific phosphodiesterase class I)
MQRRGAGHVQQDLKDKVVMMNRILKALEQDHFVPMAQPIQGIRGDRYHEVLLRMQGESGELIGPNAFLPVAHEFGLPHEWISGSSSTRWTLWIPTGRRCPAAACGQSLLFL